MVIARRAAVTLALLAAFATLTAGCAELRFPDLRMPVPGRPVVYPRITPLADAPAIDPPERAFEFEGRRLSIDVAVDGTVYAGARKGDKSARRLVEVGEKDWVPGYYRAFKDEEHLTPFYDSLLARTRALRSQLGLDSDRYLELLVAFVQSLPYAIDESRPEPKYPIETYVDGRGDCDDKSLLLAALLSREGYDVVLLRFGPERHVAIGVRAPGAEYRGSSYAYVETTLPSLVGLPPEKVGDGQAIDSEPWVLPMSDGGTPYSAGSQVAWLRDARARAVVEQERLAVEVEETRPKTEALAEAAAATRSDLDSLRAQRRVDEYNAKVSEYNQQIAAYNAAARNLNTLAERHNTLIAIVRYIDEHPNDRPGTFAWVRGRM